MRSLAEVEDLKELTVKKLQEYLYKYHVEFEKNQLKQYYVDLAEQLKKEILAGKTVPTTPRPKSPRRGRGRSKSPARPRKATQSPQKEAETNGSPKKRERPTSNNPTPSPKKAKAEVVEEIVVVTKEEEPQEEAQPGLFSNCVLV